MTKLTAGQLVELVEQHYFQNVDGKNIGPVLDCFAEDAVLSVQTAGAVHSGRDGAIRKMFELFQRFGVSEDEFSRTWNSFEVDQKLRVAGDLVRRYNITAVPTIVVNGKYRVSAATGADLFEIVDELTVREGLR